MTDHAITFGSVCSGIEAASLAFNPLGWRAAWFAEIDPFASAVLAHHYPEVPNLGDLTTIAGRLEAGELPTPDVLCGGTPCQAFSVAGSRRSLDDERGSLSLAFCRLADALDAARSVRGLPAAAVFWENVPGVLSVADNAFGCFLAGLAGSDEPLEPEPRPAAGRSSRYWAWNQSAGVHAPRWPGAGAVLGPARAVAWRILDAQFFGVAQRRRRVFVVASARDGFDPAAVLLEFDGVRRDLAPRREAREGSAAGTLRSSDGGSDVDHARAGHVVGALTARFGRNGGANDDVLAGRLVTAQAFGGNRTSGPIDVAPALLAQPGSGWRGDFESETFCVQAPATIFTGDGETADPISASEGKTYTHEGSTFRLHNCVGEPLAFKPGQSEAAGGTFVTEGYAPTLQAQNNGSPAVPAVLIAPSLTAANDPSRSPQSSEVTAQVAAVHSATMRVRRLTPVECERLQGMPDGYTAIPWRTWQEATRKGVSYEGLLRLRGMRLRGPSVEECPDGPRYRAIGNSWAGPCAAWIGARMDAVLRALAGGWPHPFQPAPARDTAAPGANDTPQLPAVA